MHKLEQALQVFVGTHDFRSFATGDEKESTVRTIDAISLHYCKRLGAYRIMVTGKGFLKYMVRRIVGACLEVASHDILSIDDLEAVLAAKNPEHHLPKAPAQGLLLRRVCY